MPSDLDPQAMVERLEQLRSDREEELGHPVKLVLLLDEVSLFIGTDFDRLTELQTLAESVDETGDGDIQLVANGTGQNRGRPATVRGSRGRLQYRQGSIPTPVWPSEPARRRNIDPAVAQKVGKR